ncbi:MAG: amino acid ABC transporter permease [Clostridia bacterium]|nr:amino acid ABC transporter permease [Clostridia bacterium]
MTGILIDAVQGGFFDSQFWNVTATLAEGLLENIKIFFFTLLFALPLGMIITMGSMTKFRPLRWLTRTFVWVIRGTPLMLQLFVVLYVPGLVFGIPMRDRMTAALIAFVINYSAYFSEIYRGGIESIPKGQYEACQVLGMSKSQTFFRVILMQVIKRVVPPMGNEIITLVKDTSLARVIAVAEILKAAEIFSARGIIWPLFYTGAFFLIFCGLLTVLFGKIEKKLDYYKG